MNWSQYVKYLDEKVSDAWYNMERAEKEFRQTKAAYDSAMRERASFDKAMMDKLEKLEKEQLANA